MKITAFLLFFLILSTTAFTATVFVPDNYSTIQDAVNNAQFGDTIIVRPGTYQENVVFYQKALTLQSEVGPELTIIDGAQNGSCVTFIDSFNGTLDGFTITNGSGSDLATLLISYPTMLMPPQLPGRLGGGILCLNSGPSITNNIITGNGATGASPLLPDYGGGMAYYSSAGMITNNTISNNVAATRAGGLSCYAGSFPFITGNAITGNSQPGGEGGGGIYNWYNSVPIMTQNEISGNSTTSFGGGIAVEGSIALTDNLISGNQAGDPGGTGLGGGIYAFLTPFCSANIMRNTIVGNWAFDKGGAIYATGNENIIIEANVIQGNSVTGVGLGGGICAEDVFATIQSNVIADNSAGNTLGLGGGIYSAGLTSSLTNNTFFGNTSDGAGGGFYCAEGAGSTVVNCVFWNNDAPSGPEIQVGDDTTPASLAISYSDVDGSQASVHVGMGNTLSWGAGMIDADPLFVDGPGFDLHLSGISPCINAGDKLVPLPPTDFEGDPRVIGDDVEIGADETEGAPGDPDPPVVEITSPNDGDVIGDFSVVLEATITDASETTVLSDPTGISEILSPGGGQVSGTLSLIEEGPNTLTVTATDSAENVGAAAIVVTRDTIAPGVTIISPTDGAVFGVSPASLSVGIVDATTTTVVFGANSFVVEPEGDPVNGPVDLIEGYNTILVTATDAGGNVTNVSITLVLDLTAPIVTIDTPANNAAFGPGQESIAVSVTVDDLTQTQIVSSPAGVAGSLPAGGGAITGVIDLLEGWNELIVTATDETYLSSADSICVNLDTTKPDLEIIAPFCGSIVSGTIEFEAEAFDALPGTGISLVELTVDGNLVASFPGVAPFAIDYDTTVLSDGQHSFGAVAFDGIGNMSNQSVCITVDNTSPLICIADPLDGSYVTEMMDIEVSGSDATSGIAEIEILSGNESPTNDPSTVFDPSVGNATLFGADDTTEHPDGPLTVTATAVDAAGNEAEAEATVEVDNINPRVRICRPRCGSKVRCIFPITVRACDPNIDQIEVRVDGDLIGTSNVSPFTIYYDSTNRLDGRMVITATARDLVGRTATDTVIVCVDNLSFCLLPRSLTLMKGRLLRFCRTPVMAKIEGVTLPLMMPYTDHDIALHIPGGSPVPVVKAHNNTTDCDNDGKPEWRVWFDRRAFSNSIRAGIASGVIPQPTRCRPARIKVKLVVDGNVIGKARIVIRGLIHF
jgi:hypothetical protein